MPQGEQDEEEEPAVEYQRIPTMDISKGVAAKPPTETRAKTRKQKAAEQLGQQSARNEDEQDEQMEEQRGRRIANTSNYDDSGDEYEQDRAKFGVARKFEAKAHVVLSSRSLKKLQEYNHVFQDQEYDLERIRLRHWFLCSPPWV